MYLNGVEDFSIVCGDTLRNPAFLDGSRLRTFDIVLANPPYSIKEWDRAAFENDKWGRNFLGTPPQGRADYAFIQHILASMDEKSGRCAILLPHGVLFREEEKHIRKQLVEADLLDCIIGIGENLFFNASMEACILVCSKNKPEERKNKILFIDAKSEVSKMDNMNYLDKAHIDKIQKVYHNYTEVDKFSKVVTNQEISDSNWLLSIQTYVDTLTTDASILTIEESLQQWQSQSTSTNSLIESLSNLL